MAGNRDRLRILGAALLVPIVGFGATKASADTRSRKKAAKKKAKKKAAKKKAMRVSEPGSVALVGAALAAAGVARKLRQKKKRPLD
jgi:hypothetical protein